ncbi:hypothetical protein GCU69_05450 [Streptomyces lycii]|uniref:LysR substrate-binding domain-containing protein n=2 Tax=Streptomyces lycii TaxID=2654337 RepID=A0ABQ7FRK2_9ACTN|nr:hypothetical protein GCU69_05450 [Streptomyces lycii]
MATPGTLCRAMAERACRAAGFTPRVRHQVDDFPAVLGLVAAGQGVALVPQLAAARPPRGVVLLRLRMVRRTKIAFRAGARAHPAVAALSVALRDSLGELAEPGAGTPGQPPPARAGGRT